MVGKPKLVRMAETEGTLLMRLMVKKKGRVVMMLRKNTGNIKKMPAQNSMSNNKTLLRRMAMAMPTQLMVQISSQLIEYYIFIYFMIIYTYQTIDM